MKRTEFRKDSIRSILENPFYAGMIARYPRPRFETEDNIEHPENIPVPSVDGKRREILSLHPGQHEALIPISIWQAANDLRHQKNNTPIATDNGKRIYMLSGVGRCWECYEATGHEYTLRGSTGGKGTAYYRCAYLHDSAIKRSPSRRQRAARLNLVPHEINPVLEKRHASLHADRLESQVNQLVSRLVIPLEWREATLAYYLSDDGMGEFEREGYNLRQSLKRYRDLYLQGHISKNDYDQQARFITHQLDALKPSASPEAREILPLLDVFPATWMQLNNGEKRAMLGTLFAGLYFDRDGELRHILAHEPFGELLGLS